MAETITYDYSGGATITIKNVIDEAKYRACDAGTPAKKVIRLYSDIKDKPCVKFDYIFNEDGSFAVGTKDATTGVITVDSTLKYTDVPTDDEGKKTKDYVVSVQEKLKNTDRLVPAYRTMNAKTLKVGESMKFSTCYKDEVVFYEKLKAAFEGELEVTIEYKGGTAETA